MTTPNWDAVKTAMDAALSWDADEPGGAMVVFDASGPRATLARGLADLSSRVPFDGDTVSRFASVTKHVFASFVLSHPDVITLDDPLSVHLPMLAPAIGAITVGQALDMSGGVPDTRECLTLIGHSMFQQTFAPDLLAFHGAMTEPNYPPGTEVHYSNGGYRLVEEAMRTYGLLFDDFVAELRDAGIAFQTAQMWTDPVPGLVPGYWHDEMGWHEGFQGMHLSAAGSLAGSARSLADWGRMLLSGKGHLAALCAPRTLNDGTVTGYGLGLRNQWVGGCMLVGHGGSQAGYKSYLLLDQATGTGCAVVANRDDANTSDISMRVMAALLGEALPQAGSDLVPGLYVGEGGGDWIRVSATSVTRLDDEGTLYRSTNGGETTSPTALLRLRMDGTAIVGSADHAPRRYLPVGEDLAMPDDLDGAWVCTDLGARLDIAEGAVVMGMGPSRVRMPLGALGQDSYIFTRPDGPARHRICLHRTGADRITLVLSRAKKITYHRA